MKKFFFAAFGLALITTSFASSTVIIRQKQKDPYANAVVSSPCYSYNSSNPCESCDPCNFCGYYCGEWSAQVDWLYWKTRRCGLDYAWQRNGVNDEILLTLGKGSAKDVEPKYDGGIRIGVFDDYCDWKYGVRYTYFSSDETDSFNDTNSRHSPSRAHPDGRGIADDEFEYAKAKYEVDLDIFDFEVGRGWDIYCGANVSLFGGVKLAFIDQDMKTLYSDDKDNPEGSTPIDYKWVKEKVDMDAYGIYIGAEGHWSLCQGLGLFGRASAGTLLANFDRKFFEEEPNEGPPVIVDVKDCSHCHVNHLEFAAGIDYHFCQTNCGDWTILVGYEFHTWCNMRDFINFTDDNITGHPARGSDSLGFDGLFVRVNVTF